MLEGAANELRRTQGMLPEEGGDFPSPRASAYADDGRGAKTGFEAKDGDGVGDEDGGGVAAGADGEGKIDGKGAAQATPEDSVESHRAILRELSEFRRVSQSLPACFPIGISRMIIENVQWIRAEVCEIKSSLDCFIVTTLLGFGCLASGADSRD